MASVDLLLPEIADVSTLSLSHRLYEQIHRLF